MPHDYVYDQGFSEERARPAGIESLWDPGSQVALDSLGIAGGWPAWRLVPAAARWSSGWRTAARAVPWSSTPAHLPR
ncbi:MAG: hypothetical protein ACRDT5_18190 [Mycobacterium sp.]